MAADEMAVRLNGEDVGALVRLRNGRIAFAFDPAYAERADRPVLSLAYAGPSGGVREGRRATTGGGRAPPYFANLLPEGHLRTYLAARAGVPETLDFALLGLLGRDLPGAVEVVADDGWSGAGPVDEAAPEQAAGRGVLRFSLAGVQLKFSALEEAAGGLTLPARGVGGDWIVKLPSALYDGVPENEFAVMRMAAACGIEVPQVRLLRVSDVDGLPDDVAGTRLGDARALAVRRFDRAAGGARVHTEDFAQVFGQYPSGKYERYAYRHVAQVLGVFAEEDDVVEFARRLVFCAMVGNADMHLKNWSLVYRDGRHPALAPAYDLLSTTAYLRDDTMALRLGNAKRWGELTLADFRALGEYGLVGGDVVVDAVAETVERFRTLWRDGADGVPVEARVAQAVDRQLAIVPAAGAIRSRSRGRRR